MSTSSKRFWFGAIAVAVVGFSWLPQLLNLNPGTSYGDEGLVAQAAFRIYRGEVPYRDFFSAATPGAYYWSAFFLELFGPTFLSLRLGVLAASALVLAAALWVLRRLDAHGPIPYLMVVAYLAFFGGPYWFVASHHWVSSGFCLVSLALLLNGGRKTLSRADLFASGVFAALAGGSLQHKGGVWVFAASVALLAVSPGRKRKLLWFWAGISAVALPLAILLLVVVGWGPFVDQAILFPLTQYDKISGHHEVALFRDLVKNWENLPSLWPAAASFAESVKAWVWHVGFWGRVACHVLPLFAMVGLLGLWRAGGLSRENLIVLSAFVVAMYVSTLHRLHETTLVFAGPAAVLVVAIVCDRLLRGEAKWSRWFGRLMSRAWVSLFACIAIGFVVVEALPGKIVTDTPAGSVVSLYPGEAQTLEGVVGFMREHRRPGETIFCYSYSPMFYFLLQAENPTPFDTLTYPMHTEEQLHEAQAILEQEQVRWVIWDYGSLWNPFGQYLLANYELRERFDNAAIMERRVVASRI